MWQGQGLRCTALAGQRDSGAMPPVGPALSCDGDYDADGDPRRQFALMNGSTCATVPLDELEPEKGYRGKVRRVCPKCNNSGNRSCG